VLTLTPQTTSIASFGKDAYRITPLDSSTGSPNPKDQLSVLPIPFPAGPLGSVTFPAFPNGQFGIPGETPTPSSPSQFSATNFSNLACVPYADFSADKNPVCVELQLSPSGPSGGIYFYTAQADYNIDKHSLPNGIGGPAFLGKHGDTCPSTGFDINIVTQYDAATVSFGDPTKGSGSGTGSCWVAAFDPSVTAVTTTVKTFNGFTGLLAPPQFNLLNPGQAEPLNFTYKTSSGTPITNLHYCSNIFNCSGVQTPWVAFGTLPVSCSTGIGMPSSQEAAVAGGSNLQNFGGGSYRFNLKTTNNKAQLNTCFTVITQFNTGLVVFPDNFKFSK
jgi:hypothetical protein